MQTEKLTKEERQRRLAELLEETDRKRLAELADHPNPAITVWRMLPGSHYGAVFKDTKMSKVVGFDVRTAGEHRFMPIAVAKQLVKDGKCMYSPIGDLWLMVNPDWKPAPKRSKSCRA